MFTLPMYIKHVSEKVTFQFMKGEEVIGEAREYSIMKYCMNRFTIENPTATNSDTFKLGTLIAMFSAIVFSVITVADHLYIFPEYYQSLYAAMIQEYSKFMSAARIDEMKAMLADAPKTAFIGTFIYCFLFGTVLSLILSRNIPSKDPFHNYKPDEQ